MLDEPYGHREGTLEQVDICRALNTELAPMCGPGPRPEAEGAWSAQVPGPLLARLPKASRLL